MRAPAWLFLCLLAARTSSGQSSCECDGPPCPEASDLNGECVKMPRADCPCCLVCAGQVGDDCDQITEPCDLSQGLVCNGDDNKCQKEKVVCNHNGVEYEPGDTFHRSDCESQCTCTDRGDIVCQPTSCPAGLLRKGFLTDDPLCQERTIDGQECCVLVVCASEEEEEEVEEEIAQEQEEQKRGPKRPINSNENLVFLQITPTSVQVQFPGITGGNLMYVEDRLFRSSRETPWENAIILEGNKIFTLTGLKPGTTYRLRWQAPDTQYPDVKVTTQGANQKQPKVIVTHKTFDTVTLSFDHFAPEDYQHGYVAMYKRTGGGRWHNQEGTLGNRDLPSITIVGLEPNTDYEARIAVYENYSLRSLGKSTGIIGFKTNDGCIYENVSYGVGQFDVGCELTCECSQTGKVDCGPKCKPPLHKSGTTAGDPLCVEQLVDGDSCCVIVTCAGNAGDDGQEGPCRGIQCGPNARCRHEVFRGETAETICVCKEGYTGDPDSSIGCSEHLSTPDRATIRPKNGCLVKNETYSVGQEWNDGCDYKCACSDKSEILCEPRCKGLPTGASDKCELRPDPEDACCNIMYCPDPLAMDNLKPVPQRFDGCVFKNETYKQGERFYDGCEQQCQCMGYGDMVCLSRCPPTAPAPGQNCYTLPDASDPCCNITVCDDPVLDPDQNVPKEKKEPRIINGNYDRIPDTQLKGEFLGSIREYHHFVSGKVYALNESTLYIKDFTYDGQGPDAFFLVGTTSDSPSENGFILAYPYEGIDYEYRDPKAPVLGRFDHEDVTLHLPRHVSVSDLKWISVWCRAFTANFGDIYIDSKEEEEDTSPAVIKTHCDHKSKSYEFGEEFYVGCDSFCVCIEDGSVACNEIKCPSKFGLDVINPFCLKWDEHKSFVPSPPICCPPVPQCLSDGSCEYQGQHFSNFDNIPANMTGCEKRCYCENGEVLCQNACYDVSSEPPGYLSCTADVAIKVPKDDRPCCMIWGCPKLEKITIGPVSLQPVNATSVMVKVRVPRLLNGRTGYFKVFFTSGADGHPDPKQWPSRIINPEDGAFTVDENDQTSVLLTELLPNQQYFLRVALNVIDENAETGNQEVVSDILSARTPSVPIDPIDLDVELRQIDVQLSVSDVQSETAFVSWRFFTLDEKKYIDGVQIRFTQLNDGVATSGVPGTTPFIHRDTNFFLLEDLQPNTEYQVDLYLIPVPRSDIELISGAKVTFKTLTPVEDPFNFNILLRLEDVGKQTVDLSWAGVPLPHQQYVNLYRILYLEENALSLEPHSAFIVSEINSVRSTRVGHLKPSTSYQVWLEAYLRNGKVAKSNVLEVTTHEGIYDPSLEKETGSYYNSMVAAAIIAAIAIIALVIILGFYLKRTTTYKAIISGGNNKDGVKASYHNKAFQGYDSTAIQMHRRDNGADLNGSEQNGNGDTKT